MSIENYSSLTIGQNGNEFSVTAVRSGTRRHQKREEITPSFSHHYNYALENCCSGSWSVRVPPSPFFRTPQLCNYARLSQDGERRHFFFAFLLPAGNAVCAFPGFLFLQLEGTHKIGRFFFTPLSLHPFFLSPSKKRMEMKSGRERTFFWKSLLFFLFCFFFKSGLKKNLSFSAAFSLSLSPSLSSSHVLKHPH